MWRLYMAASSMNFEAGRTQIHQVLGAVDDDAGDAGHAVAADLPVGRLLPPPSLRAQASCRAIVPVS